jgi:hypothetical protein
MEQGRIAKVSYGPPQSLGKDAKFQRTECGGIDRVLKAGVRLRCATMTFWRVALFCFDGLYEFLQRR